MSIVTLALLKTQLNIANDDTSQDTNLTALVGRVDKILGDYLNRNIEAADYTDEKHDGGEEMIIVNNPPLNSVSSLTDYLITLDSDDYTWYNSGIVQLYSGHFSNRPNGVVISYNGGYETVPGAIIEAGIELAQLLWEESKPGEGRAGKSSISMPQGGGTLSYIRSLNPILVTALDRYRKIDI